MINSNIINNFTDIINDSDSWHFVLWLSAIVIIVAISFLIYYNINSRD